MSTSAFSRLCCTVCTENQIPSRKMTATLFKWIWSLSRLPRRWSCSQSVLFSIKVHWIVRRKQGVERYSYKLVEFFAAQLNWQLTLLLSHPCAHNAAGWISAASSLNADQDIKQYMKQELLSPLWWNWSAINYPHTLEKHVLVPIKN